MITYIKRKTTISKQDNLVIICNKTSDLSKFSFSREEIIFIKKEWNNKKETIIINQYYRVISLVLPKKIKNTHHYNENLRIIGNNLLSDFSTKKSLLIINLTKNNSKPLFIAEGISLGNYTYTKHKTSKNPNKLKTIYVYNYPKNNELIELQNIISSVYLTKDLINEPFSHLKALDLAKAATKAANSVGCQTTILNKKKIESLKMGGLLAVNQGSLDDPTFTIIEWNPKNSKNTNPIILVGKGIVYDTGGLSLKPTANSMDLMKIDIGGAGTVIGALYAIAKNKLPVHVIGLLPATDNRPSGNAYAPGDVITMHNGKTVEVLITDAEGRLILADALSYAKK